ncbi:MAG: tetratricopeptide repeat protein [Phycisphaerales bacterium]|nr:tetratricopeptide repeat protein [Phycisphaerales bacterium]
MPETPNLNDIMSFIQEGNPDEALAALKDQVRHDSGNAALRLSLAQVELINGNWPKARDAVDTAGTLDSSRELLCQQWKLLIQAEETRAEVFAGEKTAIVMGDPEPWIAGLQDALRLDAEGHGEAAKAARDLAMEEAPARSGTIDDTPFAWLCDTDERIGPTFEAVINGRYTWLPQSVVINMEFHKPAELVDLVWAEAVVRLKNGGETTALIPTRYPKSETSEDGKIRLARLTTFEELPGGTSIGLGQRMFATDADDYPILQVSSIRFDD